MRRLYRAGAAALMAAGLGAAHAQGSVSTQPETPAQGEPGAAGHCAAPPRQAPRRRSSRARWAWCWPTSRPSAVRRIERSRRTWRASFAMGASRSPAPAASRRRRQDDVERGLDAELLRRDRVRVNLSFRYDQGRSESDSDQLRGMGNIKATVRTRLGLRWQPAPQWSLSLASSLDALGNGGGYTVEAGVSRSFVLDARQRVSLSAGLTGAGDRYLQTWYGVTAEQSARSGYPGVQAERRPARRAHRRHLAHRGQSAVGRLCGARRNAPARSGGRQPADEAAQQLLDFSRHRAPVLSQRAARRWFTAKRSAPWRLCACGGSECIEAQRVSLSDLLAHHACAAAVSSAMPSRSSSSDA